MWYESALIATVIGTVLGFTLALIPSWIRKSREKKSLKFLINAEVERIVAYCKARKVVYERYRDLVASGGAFGVYYSDRDMDAIFSSNLGAIVHLNKSYAVRVARFYSNVADFKARASALGESLRAHNAGQDTLTDKNFFVGSLEKLNETLAAIIDEGEQILASDA